MGLTDTLVNGVFWLGNGCIWLVGCFHPPAWLIPAALPLLLRSTPRTRGTFFCAPLRCPVRVVGGVGAAGVFFVGKCGFGESKKTGRSGHVFGLIAE